MLNKYFYCGSLYILIWDKKNKRNDKNYFWHTHKITPRQKTKELFSTQILAMEV